MNFDHRSCRILFAVLIALASALPAHAQDSHYWYDQFGNRALLLSGAVVGDPADLSATYYNPGGLALIGQKELLLAGLVINLGKQTFKDAVGEGEDLRQRSFDIAPSLIAGEVPLGESGHRFAYSVLKRYGGEFRAVANANFVGDDFGVPVLDLVSNNVRTDNRLSEYWMGGTWAYPVRERLGVGVSTYIAARSQRSYATNTVQALTESGRAAAANVVTDYSYWHWRMLWKLGVQGQFQNWDVGLSVTTPSWGWFGSGRVGNNLTLIGQDITETGDFATVIANDFQRSLPTDYRSPLSIAGGAGRSFGDTSVHLTVEYFAPVDNYTVIDGQPFTSQIPEEAINTAIISEDDDVVNVGVGVEHDFSQELHAYFGFHTDFNSASTNPAVNLHQTSWDFYHISGGATIRAGGTSFTLGGELALAGDTLVLDTNDPFTPIGLPPEIDTSAYRLTILLGFSFLSGSAP